MSIPELLDEKKNKKIFGIVVGNVQFEKILLQRIIMFLVLNPGFKYDYITHFISSVPQLTREDALDFLEEQNIRFQNFSSFNVIEMIRKIELWEEKIIGEKLSNKDLKKIKTEVPLLDQYINERLCGKLLKPFQIEQNLSRYIVGQDKFIKDLSLEIYKYELTLRTPPDKLPDLKTNNHCIMLWGNTGSGKTYVVSRIAELFNANVISVSLNLVTSSGYYGQSLDTQIFAQYRNMRKSKKSSFSILFLDEIDKLCSKLEVKSDVLNELLVLLSDRKLSYEEKSGRKETISMKFDSYLIVMAGNFMKLKKNNNKVKRIIGFSNQANSKIEADSELADAQFLTDVLGHELVGRIGSILRVENLNKKDVLKNILLNAESSPLHYIKHFMERHNKEFVYSEKEIDEIASIAARSKTGVRGLNTATMEFYKELFYEVANKDEVVDKSIKKTLEDELPF